MTPSEMHDFFAECGEYIEVFYFTPYEHEELMRAYEGGDAKARSYVVVIARFLDDCQHSKRGAGKVCINCGYEFHARSKSPVAVIVLTRPIDNFVSLATGVCRRCFESGIDMIGVVVASVRRMSGHALSDVTVHELLPESGTVH